MKKTVQLMTVLSVLVLCAPAFAQGGGGQGGGRQRGQGGAGGFGGQRGQGGFGGGELTLATVPIKALTSALKLSDDQAAKIQAIQEKQRQAAQQMQQDMRQNFQGGGGDPQAMREAMTEMRTKLTDANNRASREIEKILTPEQATTVKSSMRVWKVVAGMGFSIEIADSLKLTEEQLTTLEKAIKDRAAQQQQGRNRGGGN